MVKKSTLVYQFLSNEKSETGFSPKEILDKFSETHGVAPGKGLKRQINAALRRGVDFGILTRRWNRYKFDMEDAAVASVSRRTEDNKPKRRKRTTKKPKAPEQRRRSRRNRKHSPDPSVPKPHVPPPPNWTPKRRNLREEPLPKFIKHPETPFS